VSRYQDRDMRLASAAETLTRRDGQATGQRTFRGASRLPDPLRDDARGQRSI